MVTKINESWNEPFIVNGKISGYYLPQLEAEQIAKNLPF